MILDQASAGFAEAQWISRLVFGNQDRLVVAAAVAASESGSIFGRNLAEQLGITDNRVGSQLKNFEQAGLLVRLPKVGGEQRVYYERVDSTFWDMAASLAAEIAGRA